MDLYRHYGDFLNTIPDGAIVVTGQGYIELANTAAEHMFGYSVGELNQQQLEILIPPSARISHQYHTDSFFNNPRTRPMGEGLPLQFLGLRKDGSQFHVEITISPLTIEGEKFAVAIIRDSSERQRTEQRIRRELETERSRALTDDLTGLANRRLFLDLLNQCVNQHSIDESPFALAYIDLDNFKAINDSQGHQAGDKLLQRIASIMQQACRGNDTLARLGGDEFALIIRHVDQYGAEKMLLRLHQLVNQALIENSIPTSMSIGWAHSAQQEIASYRDLLHAADEAMYAAKRSGKNSIHNAADIHELFATPL